MSNIEHEDPYLSMETFERTFRDAIDEHFAERQRHEARVAAVRKLLSLNVTILQAPSLRPGEIMVDPETYQLLRQFADYEL